MNISLSFIRVFFFFLSAIGMTAFFCSHLAISFSASLVIGIALGGGFGILLMGFEVFLKKFHLRSFNLTLIGMLLGYLMGKGLLLVLDNLITITPFASSPLLELTKTLVFLLSLFTGTILTLRASEELHLTIPFVKFTPLHQKKKDLIADKAALSDARLIDLASSGLIDHQLVIPRFLMRDLCYQLELDNEIEQMKARHALDIIKKLETLPDLNLRFSNTDFPGEKSNEQKLLRLAKLTDANLLSASTEETESSHIEGIKQINLHALSEALKPLVKVKKILKIKVQRYGKEPLQGIGYLEDGAMVVINGGGNFLGETIKAQVLSAKHTPSGRIIFCNIHEQELAHAKST